MPFFHTTIVVDLTFACFFVPMSRNYLDGRFNGDRVRLATRRTRIDRFSL
jgi:hypothetical protein